MATVKKKTSAKPVMRSLKRAPETPPFFAFRLTHQSVYWLILCLLILALGIWVIALTIKVQSIYDQVDRANAVSVYQTPAKQ